jgi:hypothetical protein
MFLTNWLMVTRIVAASVIEAVDYPTPEEFFLAFDGTNTLFMYGGSKDTSSTSNVAIYYDGYKHETGNAYPVVLSEPGEYKALVDVCGTRYLTEAVTVGAMTPPSIPIGTPSTLAFHHGNFDNVYGDGDVSTAATNGHVYADTPTGTYSWGTLSARSTTSTNTTYEWTPSATMIADVLMVAGGGGGGNWYSGGGGGAGGLVFLENGSISGQKTVVVGNGGSGATNNPLVGGGTDDIPGSNGSDTSMSGFTTAIGGGGGASYNVNGNSGGSGGGGGYNTTGGAGTNNQGYDGGDSYLNGWGGGGGGGSGGPGYDETSNKGGNGGIGTNLSSIYGVLYGDSGFFASGGGGSGGTRTNDPSPGTASQGGGTSGVSSGSASDAQKHTGGGGGGAGWNNSSSLGGDGGSGIVLLSYQYSTDQLTYNNYNKLTIANTSNANVETNLRLGANTWDIATGSNVWICKPGDYKSFTVDPDGQTAYFGNVTVGTVTEQLYDPVADLTENSEIDHGTSTSTLKSCSISVDGTRIALGADDGRVKIYHLETGVWTLKKEYTKSTSFGTQVCLNDAGTRLFVSDPADNSNTGKVYVYDYSGSAWGNSETHSWVSPDGNANDDFGGVAGKGIDCNSDGTRLLVVTGYTGIKKAWIFDHNGTNWNTLATKTWTSSSAWWGVTCALNDTGDRAFIGYENGVDIFHYDGSNWPTSATKNYTGSGRFGASLTINGAGTRLLVGAYDYNSSNGQTTLYDYTGSVWNTLATQVINGSNGTDTYYGSGIHMSRDGKRYLVSTHNSSTYFSNGGYVELMEDTSGTGTFSLKQTFQPDAASEYMGTYQFQEGLCLDQNGYSAVILSTGTDVSRFYSAPAPQPSLLSSGTGTPGTLAFHHGTFDNAYGDGDVATATLNGRVYADTPTGTYLWGTLSARSTTSSNTTYEWTPIVDMTGDVLMVAGGGGGGSGTAGGGGAGGLLHYTNQSLSGQKTIVVGNGGAGNIATNGNNGSSTLFTGLTTAVGGGGGGGNTNRDGRSGGSGGGAAGTANTTYEGSATSGQGNAGGKGYNYAYKYSGGGGGGAGGTGNSGAQNVGGDGGDGIDKSSTFGMSYGVSGWFAGGGGGAGYTNLITEKSSGGIGGGGGGGVRDNDNPQNGQKHTGGGGGGTLATTNYGGDGGSGIVLIYNVVDATLISATPSLTYDGYNKLTTFGGYADQTLYKDSNSWSLGTASDVYIAESGEYIYFTRDADTAFLANVVVGSVSVDLTLSETSIVKQFIYDENGYTDAYFSEASETQCIRLSSDGLAMALGDGNYNSNDGRLYYYERSSISDTFTKTHTFDAVSSGLEFGASVDMNAAKTRIAISGSDADTNAANAGRVYIYDRASTSASWPSSPTATITPPASTIIRFGHTVNMSDDGLTMITSGDGTDSTANKGGVYVYEYASGSWSKTFQVTQNILRFGYKVAMNKEGTRFIAGGTGTAYYVYHKVSGTWSSTVQLTGATGYNCGMSPDGNTVAVGIVQYSSNLGRVAVYKYSGGSWGSATNIDTTVGSGIYSFGNTPVFNNDGTLLVTGCSGYNSYMGCFEMWKYESGSWVFKKQFLNPTVNTGEFFGSYLSMDYAGTSLIVSDTGNDVAGENYGRVVLYGAGSLPSLTYDGLNSLKVTGAETSSYITYKAYESNKFLACGTDLTTYPLSKTGNYKAEIAGSSTFTLTSNVLVPATNIVPLYQYPPTDGTTSGVTGTVTADVNSIWTVSGAGYGNGLYHAQASVAATSTSVTAYHAFDSNLTVGFETTSSTIGTLRVQLPSTETVHKYVVWPKAADGNRPKSWTIEGSQDAATWTTIHTVTDSPPSLSGDIHEIYSPAAYVYYRINVLANNGGTGLEIAELVLWGDVAFSITFSDGWVTTNGSNTIPIGTSYTLPTYTSSLPVKVTGASDLDVNTAGTYKVVYTSIGIDELARRVVRQFVVEYPAIAFHYAGFVATDYNSTYATKEAAAADGFVYADTPDGTYSWGTLTVTSNTTSNTQYTWTPVTAITADVLMVAGGGGGAGYMGSGGGAGGLLFNTGVTLSGQKTVVVGNGGEGGDDSVGGVTAHGTKGNNTIFSGLLTVVGGGCGLTYNRDTIDKNGGSGGGGNSGGSSSGSYLLGGSGVTNQGNNGGNSQIDTSYKGGGGGGGGAGLAGSDADVANKTGGNGGNGLDYSFKFGKQFGENGYFAGGGGGAGRYGTQNTYGPGTSGVGGLGGGGDGAPVQLPGLPGKKHTGGGGGGGALDEGNYITEGGSGGSGIVLVKRTA